MNEDKWVALIMVLFVCGFGAGMSYAIGIDNEPKASKLAKGIFNVFFWLACLFFGIFIYEIFIFIIL